LADPASSAAQRRDALKFVVHLVGDVNQPLHMVGELRGYNDLTVCYFSSPAKNDCLPTNLHIVWDVGLIRSIFWDWGGYVDYLETRPLCLWMESVWLLRGGGPANLVQAIRLGFLGPWPFRCEDPRS
jgi:hypothetical protein